MKSITRRLGFQRMGVPISARIAGVASTNWPVKIGSAGRKAAAYDSSPRSSPDVVDEPAGSQRLRGRTLPSPTPTSRPALPARGTPSAGAASGWNAWTAGETVVVNLRPETDPETEYVSFDRPRVLRVLARISADLDELAGVPPLADAEKVNPRVLRPGTSATDNGWQSPSRRRNG